jgi:hypothetical protein
MDELPFHYSQLCQNIKQWAIELGDPELPHQMGARHHALLDARWIARAAEQAAAAEFITRLPDGYETLARRAQRFTPNSAIRALT